MSENADDRTLGFAPGTKLAALKRRAELLEKVREFFSQRDFLEVETPLLSNEIIPELHLEPITIEGGGFLQASPELHMKRLIAAGALAIFQVTHSFRAGERGPLHNPEFTIVEWYRRGDNMQAGMNLLDELMQHAIGTPPARRTTYAEAFQRQFGLCPHTASPNDLASAADASHIEPPQGMEHGDRDAWLHLLMAQRLESTLGRDRPEIIYYYPASQASLAKLVQSDFGYAAAERFELYYRGVELANGFRELTDAAEQRHRFQAVNAARLADGRPALPLPELLLNALEHGMPDCTGCALGFDRLAMLAIGAHSIHDVASLPIW